MREAQVERVLVTLLVVGFSAAVFGQGTDPAGLLVLAQEMAHAYSQKDAAGVLRLWSEKAPQRNAQQNELDNLFGDSGIGEIHESPIGEPEVTGDRARWRMSRETVGIPGANPKTNKKLFTVECVKEPGGWKVWKETPAAEELAALLTAAGGEKERSELLSRNEDLIGTDLARALLDRGRAARSRGNANEALDAFDLALRIAQQADEIGLRALALSFIAAVRLDLGEYQEAVSWGQKALEFEAALPDKTPVAQALLVIGAAYRVEGEFALSSDSFQRSLALAEALHNDVIVGSVLGNMAALYGDRGDYVRALSYLNRSVELAERSGDKRLAAGAEINLGTTFSRQGEYGQAEDHYRRALARAEAIGNRQLQALAWMDLGQINDFAGDFANALVKYEKSLAICNETGDKTCTALNLTYIGNLHFERKEYAEAIENFQKSLEIREAMGSQGTAGQTLTQMAAARNARGEFEEALRLSRQALDIANSGGQREIAWRAYLQAGTSYRGLNDAKRAEINFTQAIATIEDIRLDVAGGESARETFFENKLEPYRRMVDLLVAERRTSQALEYAERAKARALLDVLKSGRPQGTRAVTAQELQRDRELRVKLAALNARVVRESPAGRGDTNVRTSLNNDIEKARREYNEFQAGLYVAHPELKLQRGEVDPLSPDDARHILPDAETALVEFVVTSDRIFVFAADSRSLQVFSQPIERRGLAEQVERFRQQLANRDLAFRATAARLYALTLAPAEALLKGKRKLLILPDDVLWDVPFQALVTPARRYVLDDYAISYAPSLTALKAMMKVKQERQHAVRKVELLAMGNPLLSQQGLPPLPFAELEVRRLQQLYGPDRSRIYLGAEARESRFKAEAGDAKVLHLATHAILDNASPLYSHLLLTPEGGASSDDGFVEAWELMNLHLGAELAVLSACETARGRVGAGEGMIGISWALFVSGVPTTVLSQWKVDSASTSQFMIVFHESLRRGENEAQAIQHAALELRKNPSYQHPFYWAPFVMVGAGR
jgi:CHAT domain-containing protein